MSSGQFEGQNRRDSMFFATSGSVERPSKRSSVLSNIVGKFCGQSSLPQGQRTRSTTLGRYVQQRRDSILSLTKRETQSFMNMTRRDSQFQGHRRRESVASVTSKAEGLLSMGSKLSMFGGRMVAIGSLASQDSVASNSSVSSVLQRVTRGVMFVSRLKKLSDSRCFRTILNTAPEDRTELNLTRISRMLNGIAFFDRLSPAIRMRCYKLLRHVEAGPQEIIFEEGDPGDLFYVILEGAVAVHILPSGTKKENVTTRRNCLARRRSGFVGVAASRRSTIIRKGSAAAAAFVSQKLSKEELSRVKDEKALLSPARVAQAVKLDARRQRQRLVKLLGLQPDQEAAANDMEKQLQRIGGRIRRQDARLRRSLTHRTSATAEQPHAGTRGSVLSSAEDDGAESEAGSNDSEHFFPDSEGEVDGKLASAPELSEEALELHYGRRVAVLQRGSVFGEVSLESDKPRTATIRTLKTCQFGVLHRTEFQAMLKGVYEAEKLERLAFLKTVPLFVGWSEAALDAIVPLLHQRDLKKKECLFDEGGAALQVFFIRDGEFELRRRPDHSLPCWQTKKTPWRRRRSLWCTVAIATAPNAIGLLDALSEVHTYSERAVCRTASGRVYGILARELDSRLDKQARQRTIDSVHAHDEFAKSRMSMLQHFVQEDAHHSASPQKAACSHHQPQTSRPSSGKNIYDAEARLQMIAGAGADRQSNSSTESLPTQKSRHKSPALHLTSTTSHQQGHSQKPHLTSITPVGSPKTASTPTASAPTSLAAALARSVSSPKARSVSSPKAQSLSPSSDSSMEATSPLPTLRAQTQAEEEGRWGSLLHNFAWSARPISPSTHDRHRRHHGHGGEPDSLEAQVSTEGKHLPGTSSEPLPLLLGGAAQSRFLKKLDHSTPIRRLDRP